MKMEKIITLFLSMFIMVAWMAMCYGTNIKYSKPGQTYKSRCNQNEQRFLAKNVQPIADGQPACQFYHCVNTYYVETSCSVGTAVSRIALRKAAKKIAQNVNPCVSVKRGCGIPTTTTETSLLNTTRPKAREQQQFCGVDLFWVIDMSCSIQDHNKQAIVKFVMEVVNGFQISAVHMKTGGVTYGASVYDIQRLRKGRNRAITLKNFQNMVTIPARCQTATDEALLQIKNDYLSHSSGNRPEFPDVLIIITDGRTFHGKKENNTAFSEKTIQTAKEIRKLGVILYVIGLPSGKRDKITEESYTEWFGMAGIEKNIFLMANFDELKKRVNDLSTQACAVVDGV